MSEDSADLSAGTPHPDDLYDQFELLGVDVGDEVWMPVTLVRDTGFRAVKVEVKERASVGDYEEIHAIEDWEGDIERLGYND